MTRKMIVDDITADPEWQNGEIQDPAARPRGRPRHPYDHVEQPAADDEAVPTRDQADDLLERSRHARLRSTDANDTLYQVSCSDHYDPEPDFGKNRGSPHGGQLGR